GLCYLEKNWPKRALECFQHALEKNPKRLEFQEAVRLLERRRRDVLPRVDGPGAVAYREGEDQASRGALRRGHALFLQGLEARPHNATIRISYALSCAALGLWKEVVAACREVLEGEPEDVVAAAACSTLAEALRAEGKNDEAARFVREFLQRHPSKT